MAEAMLRILALIHKELLAILKTHAAGSACSCLRSCNV